jgi:glutamyl-tRNA(Gln) amidotransferase subunit E
MRKTGVTDMGLEVKKLTIIDEELDYFDEGLKCGLEIHQQLNTNKLFCNCKLLNHEDVDYFKPDFIINRKLRVSKSELGEIDAAAKFESRKGKLNQYYGFNNTSCLVELDEEPPHNVNKEALDITLEVAKYFHMKIVDKLTFMRKIVVDGSNTGGFQRTGMVAVDGILEEKNVRIEAICLEEEACKKIRDYVSDKNEMVSVYDLSRLGVPLIELATAPDIKTPNQAKEVSEFIGMVLRSTGKVKRGIGTIRQDVNVSIKGGVRVEIKGAQQLDLIPTFVSYEVMRQKNLNKIFAELKNIGMAVSDPTEITKILENSSSKIIKNAFKDKGKIFALKVSNAKGFFGLLIAPGRRFGTEIAGRVKVLGVKGLFHSDELPAYGITQNEVSHIYDFLGCSKDDAFILIAEEEVKALNAINEVKKYLTELKLSKEVRKPLADGTSTFLRPMPGSARMYPETDVPDFLITKDKIDSLPLIELLSNQYELLYKNYGIRESDAKLLFKKDINIQELISKFSNLKPKFIVEFLLDYPKEIKKRYSLDINISLFSNEILNELNSSSISKECSFEILVMKAKGKEVDYSKFKKISVKEVEVIIDGVIKKNPKAPMNALMGLCMAELRGKADGKLVRKILIEKID